MQYTWKDGRLVPFAPQEGIEPTWREHIEQALRLLAEGMPTEYKRREVLRVLDGAERARAAGRVG